MIIDFRVKNDLFGSEINQLIKENYELYIEHLIKEKLNFIDVSKIDQIIITKDFVRDIKEFQTHLGYKPSVTYNNFFRAFGKTIYNKENDKFCVFIDYEKGMFLMSDFIEKITLENLNEQQRKVVKEEQQIALNLLAHELCHVEFETYTYIKKPENKFTLDCQMELMIFQFISEYYACRRSSKVSTKSIAVYDENIINNIEDEIVRSKWEYKTNKISLEDFCGIFHEYTNQSIISVIYMIANLDGEISNDKMYKNCKVHKIIRVFEDEFNNIYNSILKNKNIEISSNLVECIMDYYRAFGVYISQEKEGIYYYIP